MTIQRRLYAGAADLQPLLDLKRVCTTAENIYDFPTVSDLRVLLAPLLVKSTEAKPPWEDEQGTVIPHLRQRAMTQQATMLWEIDGVLVAYALIAPPSIVLTFQVSPQAQGRGIEQDILTWALEGIQTQANQRGRSFSLWCRCHNSETARRTLLEEAGFHSHWQDLRLASSLASPLPAAPLPSGFVLRQGVHGNELERYQDLHQAVFDGTSIGLDGHQSPAYQPDLDLIAVDSQGLFVSFCLCELKRVADGRGEYSVGSIGVIGTRPASQKQGLGRTLLLTGMHLLKERGARTAFLETDQSNTQAMHLFTSVGFRTVSAWQWLIKEVSPSA
ncbi:MAG TPA: GNAT family N-acetyltransferase [Ktedonobacteraceae bacterium]|nr:GNAT family N-acetyltransferase [Ktedonobacteraceae bacterium]